MDVIVIGAGIVGVTTASLLRQRGAQVTVLEAAPGPALETSFANAGELSFGYSGPWATPGLFGKVPGMLNDRNGPLRFTPDLSSCEGLLWQARWLWWFALNTSTSRFERNKKRILAMSSRSKKARREHFTLDSATFNHQSLGTLQLFRDERLFEKVLKNDLEALRGGGVNFTVADADGCLTQEPGLQAIRHSIAGGIVFNDDETGDCHAFTKALAGLEASDGVAFSYSTRVESLIVDDAGVRGVKTDRGTFKADTVVLCTGPRTAELTTPLGLVVPIYGVRGYSLTTPVRDSESTVRSTILDEMTKIAITRLGDQVRVGGTAAVVPAGSRPDSRRRDMLARSLSGLFPSSIDRSLAREYWHGDRPMTPDGTPIVGGTIIKGLWLNCGHGTLGWTQSFASAELITDLLTHRVPQLDPGDYALSRYGRRLQPKRDYYLGNPQPGPLAVSF